MPYCKTNDQRFTHTGNEYTSGKLAQKQNVRLNMGKFISSLIHIHESCAVCKLLTADEQRTE